LAVQGSSRGGGYYPLRNALSRRCDVDCRRRPTDCRVFLPNHVENRPGRLCRSDRSALV